MAGSRLQKVKPDHYKGQNVTTSNWRSYLDKLKEARHFNKLDLIWGYNNIWIKEGDEWKAAFLTNKGLFKLDILKEIRRNTTREREVIQALRKKDGLTWEEDRIVYMDGRIYMPNNRKTREMILKENHDKADIKHPGQQRMMELIKRTYW